MAITKRIRDRRFQIAIPVNEVKGTVLVGGHPGDVDEIIRVNLLDALKANKPVLTGIVTRGIRVNAWRSRDGILGSERKDCVVYEGHVESTISTPDAKEALNRLADNLRTFLKAEFVEVSLADRFWFRPENVAEFAEAV